MDPIREFDSKPNLGPLIKDISRDGMSLSIYLVFTAPAFSSVKAPTMGSIRNKLVFHMNDRAEIASILGRT
jgi:S-DNA-T family DNA segregation ATPase FtsK/SpoIIIE